VRWTPILLVILLIAGAGAAIALMAPKNAQDARASVASVWSASAPAVSSSPTAEPAEPEPTPYFASLRGVKLRLPVAAASVTVLAFHQSSYADTYRLRPLVGFGDVSAAKAAAETARANDTRVRATPADESAADGDGVWTGEALELWRTARSGKRCSAIDCGAKWGTTVCSPVDGTVMRIRSYHLYGKYPDIEVQIKPDAWDDVDVFILHITDPAVTEGQHVTAGVTPVAKVRHLSAVVSGLQLRTYTTDGGNHTHVQFNIVPKPERQWVVGQDPPGLERRGD